MEFQMWWAAAVRPGLAWSGLPPWSALAAKSQIDCILCSAIFLAQPTYQQH